MYVDNNPYLPVYIDVYLQESVFASIYQCMSTIIGICQYISMYVDKNPYLPVYIVICRHQSVFASFTRFVSFYIKCMLV